MNRAPLPAPIRVGLEAIQVATVALMESTRGEDPEGIRRALARRARAIREIEPHVVRFREEQGAPGDRLLREEGKALRENWDSATAELRGLIERMRNLSGNLERQGSAIRSYLYPSAPDAGLDRSG